MATSYVGRNFTNITTSLSTSSLANRFSTMMGNVANMLATEGPVYHTWIMFQLGKSNPITFNTDTNDPNQNLITSLDIEKTGAGICNSFTLKIVYDPFNNGQDTNQDTIEKLDEFVGQALSYDIDSNLNALRGYLQYGYTSSTDTTLISPKYEFILTNASTNVKVSSGITTYTFEGVSEIATDCNYKADVGPYSADWKLIDVLVWTIFYHYGDNNNKPKHTTGEALENQFKYQIEFADELYSNSPTVRRSKRRGRIR